MSMREWGWDLDCPKCGDDEGMAPEWAGAEVNELGAPRVYLHVAFCAVCKSCGYREEVVPLDQQKLPLRSTP